MTVLEKIGFYLAMALIAVMLFMIFFSKNGVMDFRGLKAKEAEVVSRIHAVEEENQRLEEEIRSLKNDINYIKHLAKHEHEMAEQGEMIFKTTPREPEGDLQ